MKYVQASAILVLLVLGPTVTLGSQGRFQISEFMAINARGLDDEDRDEEDWIEVHDVGSGTASLEGWYLTDSADNLTKWEFPAVTVGPDSYLIVFASSKDRRNPASELHTNFKLSGSGEYLALVHPDGVTIASEFSPAYPVQAPDVSYGLTESTTQRVLLAEGAPAKALVPTDDTLEPGPSSDAPRPWTLEDLNDSAWPSGTTGIGYGYPRQIGLDVSGMRGANKTVYIRVPFVVENPSILRSLTLHMSFNDGMIAYLNGHEVARYNAPVPDTETWDSGAPTTWPVTRFVYPMDFAIHEFDFIHVGTNLLAVQGLNDDVNSPHLLIVPELTAAVVDTAPSCRYFPAPTPGKPNTDGVETLGVIISDEEQYPLIPAVGEDVQITARITPTSQPVVAALLQYRVMFNPDMTIPLLDDGKSGDGGAGDGVYGARIPAAAFKAGQMVRWSIMAVDAAGYVAKFPAYLDPLNSPQYCGTVVIDPGLTSPLPVLHWFIENPGAANTDAGTRCSMFYDGEFYDNVGIYIHGQSSRSFPKKSYNVDLNRGHNFKWAPGEPRADSINLMTTYPDKAQMRNILAYGTYRDADCPYHWVFPVRVQQNGAFWGTAHVMENGDKDWLVRMGLNADGALYKMYNTFNNPSHATSGAEKKTRKDEDNSDLQALFNGISLSGEARRRYLYDNVDVAQVVNFLAARIITGDVDCCHKNYYFYRDTGGSNEWQMWPWDVDLSFGRVWTSPLTYWDQRLNANTPLFVGNNNRMPQAIFDTPELRQMYLRRVRTLMDELLRPPGTPTDALYYEPRIDVLAATLTPDAALDAAKWGSNAWGNGSTAPCCPQSLPQAVAELKNSYLPERRRQLFNGLASGAREIPPSQLSGAPILFGVVETTPASGNVDEQYIQLLNPNGFAVDISGWTLTAGDSTQGHLFTFCGGTVIPANSFLYVAASRPAFRARRLFPTGGQALFVTGDFIAPLAPRGQTIELIDPRGVTIASITTR